MDLVLNAEDVVGESIIWSADDQTLYWVDIGRCLIQSLVVGSGTHRVWRAREIVTSIGLRASGGFIVGMRRSVCSWRPGGGFDVLAIPEPGILDNRLNEGRVAPDGSFWVGTMQDNIGDDGSPKEMNRDSGAYYRIAPDRTVKQLTPRTYGITNTMVWLEGGRFVAADTTKNALYAFDYDEGEKTIANRRDFAVGFPRGFPDGSCRDAEGYVWNCRVAGGACVARFSPEGKLDRIVELPCSWPTSCTFGGTDLRTLFVTSARFTMTAERLEENPQEGGLFAVDVGITGVPEPRFAG